MKILYTTQATAMGGRTGSARTADGAFAVELTTPKELGGPGGDDGEGFGLDVALAVSLPGLDRETAEAVVAQAHIVCPYSHATRNGLDVRLSVV